MSPAPASWQEHIAVLFRRAQFVHNVMEQSQSKEPRSPPQGKRLVCDGNALSWQDEQKLMWVQPPGVMLLCLPVLQSNLGQFIEFCRWSSKKEARRPRQDVCHRKRIKTSFFFFFFHRSWHFWTLDTLVSTDVPQKTKHQVGRSLNNSSRWQKETWQLWGEH